MTHATMITLIYDLIKFRATSIVGYVIDLKCNDGELIKCLRN